MKRMLIFTVAMVLFISCSDVSAAIFNVCRRTCAAGAKAAFKSLPLDHGTFSIISASSQVWITREGTVEVECACGETGCNFKLSSISEMPCSSSSELLLRTEFGADLTCESIRTNQAVRNKLFQ